MDEDTFQGAGCYFFLERKQAVLYVGTPQMGRRLVSDSTNWFTVSSMQIAIPLNKKARMENPNPFSCLLDDENERTENPEQVPTPSNGVEEVENRVIPTGGPSSVPGREHERTRMGCSSQYFKICVLTPLTISECRAHIILKVIFQSMSNFSASFYLEFKSFPMGGVSYVRYHELSSSSYISVSDQSHKQS